MSKNKNPAVVSLVASMEGLKKSLLTAAMHCDDVANGIQVILAGRQKALPSIAMATPVLAAPAAVAAPKPAVAAPAAVAAPKPAVVKAPKLTESVFKASTLLSVAGIVPEVGKVFTWNGKKAKSHWKVVSITAGIVTVVRA